MLIALRAAWGVIYIDMRGRKQYPSALVKLRASESVLTGKLGEPLQQNPRDATEHVALQFIRRVQPLTQLI